MNKNLFVIQSNFKELHISNLINECKKHPELLSKLTPQFLREYQDQLDLNDLFYLFVRYKSQHLADINLMRELKFTDLSLTYQYLFISINDLYEEIREQFPKFFNEFIKPYQLQIKNADFFIF